MPVLHARAPYRRLLVALLATACFAVPRPAAAQQVKSVRGFVDAGFFWYPREATNDDAHVVGDVLARVEPSVQFKPGLSLAGSFDVRVGSHDQVTAAATYWDRTLARPAFAVRTLALTYARGPWTIEVGKTFVRWGQSDILSPTDHFTARDYLVPVSPEAIAPTAARVTVGDQDQTFEVVVAPRMTPSRMPLLSRRWIGTEATDAGLPLVAAPSDVPSGTQWGVRWHQNARHVEYSAMLAQGFHHLPLLDATVAPSGQAIKIPRRYPAVRVWGGDAVAPLPLGLTLRAEAAWSQARRQETDNYGLWVVQLEREAGPWRWLGGYVGEWVSEARPSLSFAPDRGMARSLIGRVSHTSDADRTALIEAVVRRNGDGALVKAEYSLGVGAHWRVAAQILIVGGAAGDFYGQYDQNSLMRPRARFSF